MRKMVPQVDCDRCSTSLEPDVRSARATFAFPDDLLPEAYSGELCPSCTDAFRTSVRRIVEDFLTAEGKQRGGKGKAVKTAAKPAKSNGQLHVRPSRKRGSDGTPESLRTCSVCAAAGRTFVSRTRSALNQHLRHTHNTTFTELGESMPGGRNSVVAKSRKNSRVTVDA